MLDFGGYTDENWCFASTDDPFADFVSIKGRAQLNYRESWYDEGEITSANRLLNDQTYSRNNVYGDQLVMRTFEELVESENLTVTNFTNYDQRSPYSRIDDVVLQNHHPSANMMSYHQPNRLLSQPINTPSDYQMHNYWENTQYLNSSKRNFMRIENEDHRYANDMSDVQIDNRGHVPLYAKVQKHNNKERYVDERRNSGKIYPSVKHREDLHSRNKMPLDRSYSNKYSHYSTISPEMQGGIIVPPDYPLDEDLEMETKYSRNHPLSASYDFNDMYFMDHNGDREYANRIPPEAEVSRKFGILLDDLNLSEEVSEPLKTKSTNYKWELLRGQELVNEGRHSVIFYMNQLERHLDPQLCTKNPSKKLLKGLLPVEKILTALEVDLRSNPNATWLREFIDQPNCGHVVLLRLLKHLQDHQGTPLMLDISTTKAKKMETLISKEPNDEHICVLCIKAIVRNKYGFHQVLSAPRSLSTLSFCLRLSNIKTKMVVLKIFSEACEHPGGFEKILQAFEDYKLFKKERYRFESLVHSVIFGGRSNSPSYQESVLHFFNALLSNAPSLNQRVFHQQELEQAGFSADKVEKALDGLRAESVRDELHKWRNNYIDVSSTLDEFVTLKERSTMLRDEVDILQARLEEVERDKNQILLEKKELSTKIEEYKTRASELHDRIQDIKQQHPLEKTDSKEIADAIEDVVDEIFRSNASTPTPPPPPLPPLRSSSIPVPPASPPCVSPPPPPPPDFNTMRKGPDVSFKSSDKRLPMLHWKPIHKPSKDSIFMKLTPISLADELNFQEFEQMFELKQQAPPKHSITREAALLKLSSQVTVLNSNKARNILIAKRRISLEPEALINAINALDIVVLNPECAELLLKFTPTTEERTALQKCVEDFDRMAEAEKFMIQLINIERLESKLNAMAFMGTFDELFRTVSPQIESIITASVSVATSSKLSRLLEVVLAYGNYMNGGRKGFTQAFKLDSLIKLDEIKTNDKKLSFLQYLVQVIKQKFPDAHKFHEDIEVQPALNLSMETLAGDVQHLRKGLDITKSERDKQPDNYMIHNFYNRAMLKVQHISERYRKMEERYKEVCQLFCEDSKLTEVSAFFTGFHHFIERYKRASHEIEKRAQEDKTLQKAELLKSQRDKHKEKMVLHSQIAVDAVQKRRSLYDHNENRVLRPRPMSEIFYGDLDFTEQYTRSDFVDHKKSSNLQTIDQDSELNTKEHKDSRPRAKSHSGGSSNKKSNEKTIANGHSNPSHVLSSRPIITLSVDGEI